MTEHINEIFAKGLLFEAFEAQKNILIWQHIGDEIDFLESTNNYTKSLYSFVQVSSQSNFILSLGKLYDVPKKYPTLSILYFLQQLKLNASMASEIIEKSITEKLLQDYNLPNSLIKAIGNEDKSLFPLLFSEIYLEKYKDENLQSDISALKDIRDKSVAHNESIKSMSLKFEVAERLLKFATEIISVFGMAYQSTTWETKKHSLLKSNAERNAYFIKWNIDKLKNLGQ